MRIETPTTDQPLNDAKTDPLADKAQELAGKIAVCGIGYLGRIERRAYTKYGKWAWCGTSMRGLPWSSTRPVVLDTEDQDEMCKIFDQIPATTQVSDGMQEARTEDAVQAKTSSPMRR